MKIVGGRKCARSPPSHASASGGWIKVRKSEANLKAPTTWASGAVTSPVWRFSQFVWIIPWIGGCIEQQNVSSDWSVIFSGDNLFDHWLLWRQNLQIEIVPVPLWTIFLKISIINMMLMVVQGLRGRFDDLEIRFGWGLRRPENLRDKGRPSMTTRPATQSLGTTCQLRAILVLMWMMWMTSIRKLDWKFHCWWSVMECSLLGRSPPFP